MDSTQLQAGSVGYTPPEKKQLKWLDYMSFQESKLYIGLYSRPPLPCRLPIFPPTRHGPQRWRENYPVGLSTWIPNCNQSQSLILLPFRTLVSDFKASPISQDDTCQLVSCVSQNKTPLEINHPTYLHNLHRAPLVFQYFIKIRLLHDDADVWRVPFILIQSSQTKIPQRTPDFIKDGASVSNQNSAPIFVPCVTWNAGDAWGFCVFTTEAELPVTMLDDNDDDRDDDDDGGRRRRRRRNHNATMLQECIKWYNSNVIYLQSTLLGNPTPNRWLSKVVCYDPCGPAYIQTFVFHINGFV